MQRQKNARELDGELQKKSEIFEWLQDGSLILVTKDSQIQGWLNVYDPDPEFLENIKSAKINLPTDKNILEISYQARDGVAVPGIISGAVMHLLNEFSSNNLKARQFSDTQQTDRQTIFIASADENNQVSQEVLLANHFYAEAKKIKYDQDSNPAFLFIHK